METNQQNQDEIEIDLLELLRVLWSKIGYVILAALALGLLMVLVSKVFMKPQYESTTKMYVLSKQDSSSTVTSGDLQASSLLTKDYAELIQSRQVVETVIAQLNLDLTYEEFLPIGEHESHHFFSQLNTVCYFRLLAFVNNRQYHRSAILAAALHDVFGDSP